MWVVRSGRKPELTHNIYVLASVANQDSTSSENIADVLRNPFACTQSKINDAFHPGCLQSACSALSSMNSSPS